jgi:hypothetical protein
LKLNRAPLAQRCRTVQSMAFRPSSLKPLVASTRSTAEVSAAERLASSAMDARISSIVMSSSALGVVGGAALSCGARGASASPWGAGMREGSAMTAQTAWTAPSMPACSPAQRL